MTIKHIRVLSLNQTSGCRESLSTVGFHLNGKLKWGLDIFLFTLQGQTHSSVMILQMLYQASPKIKPPRSPLTLARESQTLISTAEDRKHFAPEATMFYWWCSFASNMNISQFVIMYSFPCINIYFFPPEWRDLCARHCGGRWRGE